MKIGAMVPPDDLHALGKRLDKVQLRHGAGKLVRQRTQTGIAFRFATELMAALLVGGGLGWGLDWAVGHWTAFHTKPVFMIVFFVLGAAAGIRNVMRAATEINAEIAAGAAPRHDEEK